MLSYSKNALLAFFSSPCGVYIKKALLLYDTVNTRRSSEFANVYGWIIKANSVFAFGWIERKAPKTCSSSSRRKKKKKKKKGGWMQGEKSRKKPSDEKLTYLTFKHCELGTGVDLASTVGGCALVNGFVSVCAQWLDPQDGAWAVIKLNHLGEPEQSKRAGMLVWWTFFLYFRETSVYCNT